MKATIEIADQSAGHWVPEAALCRDWITAALTAAGESGPVTVSLCFVDSRASAALNGRYRDQPRPTNVLAFPRQTPAELETALGGAALGDIVVCAELAAKEARAGGKPAVHHWAHLLIHGCLHLLGYDHIDEEDARRMEAMEIGILRGIGIPNPYPAREALSKPEPPRRTGAESAHGRRSG